MNFKSRDSELTEAIEEMAANPPSSEMQEIVKELEDEKEKLKKENKDLKNQIKKFKRAKTGQGAIEVMIITFTQSFFCYLIINTNFMLFFKLFNILHYRICLPLNKT